MEGFLRCGRGIGLRGMVIVMSIVLLSALWGCGKKAPPQPPDESEKVFGIFDLK